MDALSYVMFQEFFFSLFQMQTGFHTQTFDVSILVSDFRIPPTSMFNNFFHIKTLKNKRIPFFMYNKIEGEHIKLKSTVISENQRISTVTDFASKKNCERNYETKLNT